MAYGRPVSYYRDWISHDQPGDPYWAPTDFRPVLRDLDVPVTMTAGWYDLFLPSMLADYQELRPAGRQARLRIGAWHHSSQGLFRHASRMPWTGSALTCSAGRYTVRPPSGLRSWAAGGATWTTGHRPRASSGGTCSRVAAWPRGCPGGGADRYTYDPADPTPAVGGTSVSDGGPKDNHALEQRADVLTYTSEPLAAPLEITGPVTAELHVGSSLAARGLLRPAVRRGRQGPVGQCHRRHRPADGGDAGAAASPGSSYGRPRTGSAAGHRIRLQVSSGAHPRYARNLGSGEPLATGTTLCAVAEQAVYHDPEPRGGPAASNTPGMTSASPGRHVPDAGPASPREVIAAILTETLPADDQRRAFNVVYLAYMAVS